MYRPWGTVKVYSNRPLGIVRALTVPSVPSRYARPSLVYLDVSLKSLVYREGTLDRLDVLLKSKVYHERYVRLSGLPGCTPTAPW